MGVPGGGGSLYIQSNRGIGGVIYRGGVTLPCTGGEGLLYFWATVCDPSHLSPRLSILDRQLKFHGGSRNVYRRTYT